MSLSCDDCARFIDARLAQAAPGLEDGDREGFGTDTVAGRGGAVYIVDNLDDDGPGSLRDAVAEGNRTVLFAVGGTLVIEEDIRLSEPFITIAGETAPDPGFTVFGGGLFIETHDVLISHLSIRPGDREVGPRPDVRDAITIFREANEPERDVGKIVIDHCSLTWGIDETASTERAHDITFSNNIIAEGLAESLHSEGLHSKGLIIGTASRRVAVLGNLFAHNNDRSPLVGYDASALVVGNVIYNPGEFGIVHYGLPGCCPARATIVGNRVISGPDTPEDRGHPVHITSATDAATGVFVDDNCGGENRIEVVTPTRRSPVERRAAHRSAVS